MAEGRKRKKSSRGKRNSTLAPDQRDLDAGRRGCRTDERQNDEWNWANRRKGSMQMNNAKGEKFWGGGKTKKENRGFERRGVCVCVGGEWETKPWLKNLAWLKKVPQCLKTLRHTGEKNNILKYINKKERRRNGDTDRQRGKEERKSP